MSKYNEYQDKTILVTGGAGCVGSNLTRRLAELGAEKVIILDNMSSAYEWNVPTNDNVEHGTSLQMTMLSLFKGISSMMKSLSVFLK